MKLLLSGILLSLFCAWPLPMAYAAPTDEKTPKDAPTMLDILTTLKSSHPRLLASATTWDAFGPYR